MDRRRIIEAAFEVMRSYQQGSAMAIGDRFQCQRSEGTDWLDWASWFFRPLDEMSGEKRWYFKAAFNQVHVLQWTERMERISDRIIDEFCGKVSPALWEQGEEIAGRI